jgi:hypothetical protein
MCPPFLEVLKIICRKWNSRADLVSPESELFRGVNKQPLKIAFLEVFLLHHTSSCFSGFRPELASGQDAVE